MIHVYTAPMQPATKWVDRSSGHPLRGGWRGGAAIMCQCCWQKRRARNCIVQCFYDGLYVWCAPGKGCKDPAKIAASKRREFRNRSRGNRLAWQRRAVAKMKGTP